MFLQVEFKSTTSVKFLPTCITFMRFLTTMDSHVNIQVTRTSESFATNSASISLLTSVNMHVSTQRRFGAASFTTDRAREGFVVRHHLRRWFRVRQFSHMFLHVFIY